eukprot:TRINITY_DN67339_c1_g6_i1.p1 TRINITY_DN67339_c1_g6~~TRINITY_DN67339_c1_g6_i1.p1  ORF type:complete len:263 (+),score=81.02 TRINITY_DN67339_c1_g6_i1:3-791(+)
MAFVGKMVRWSRPRTGCVARLAVVDSSLCSWTRVVCAVRFSSGSEHSSGQESGGKRTNMFGDELPEIKLEQLKPSEYAQRARDERRRAMVNRIVRVDHAGEFGARRIYDGQLAVLRKTGASEKTVATVEEMREQELRHLQWFTDLMSHKRARPTALLPLWHVAGFALGAGTALLGERAAMACTVAVEEAIVEHYDDQLRELFGEEFDDEDDLRQIIRRSRDEEEEHKDTGLEHGAEDAPLYSELSKVIKGGCKIAIWLSERV